MSKLVNILFFVLGCSLSALAESPSESVIIEDNDVVMKRTSEVWRYPIPQDVSQGCAQEAAERGRAECFTHWRDDRVRTWFALPLEVLHPTLQLDFLPDRGFFVKRSVEIRSAPIRTIVSLLIPLSLPFVICFGIRNTYCIHFQHRDCPYLRMKVACTLGIFVVMVGVLAGVGGWMHLWGGIWFVVPYTIATLCGIILTDLINISGLWGMSGIRQGSITLGEYSVLLLCCGTFITVAMFPNTDGWNGAKMNEFFTLLTISTMLAYVSFEVVYLHTHREKKEVNCK